MTMSKRAREAAMTRVRRQYAQARDTLSAEVDLLLEEVDVRPIVGALIWVAVTTARNNGLAPMDFLDLMGCALKEVGVPCQFVRIEDEGEALPRVEDDPLAGET